MDNHQTDYQMGKEIDLLDLLGELKRRIWIILSFLIAFLFLGYIYTSYFTEPTYTSSASVMVIVEVENEDQSGEYDYLNAARLLDSVAQLMTMDVILEKVNDSLSLGIDKENLNQLGEQLSIHVSDTAFFIEISYTSTNKVLAKDIVNEVIDQTIYVTSETQEIPFLVNKIKRVSYAYDGTYTSPNKLLYMTVFTFIGMMLGSGLIFVLYLLKNTVKSKKDILELLDIQVIGEIPEYEIKGELSCN